MVRGTARIQKPAVLDSHAACISSYLLVENTSHFWPEVIVFADAVSFFQFCATSSRHWSRMLRIWTAVWWTTASQARSRTRITLRLRMGIGIGRNVRAPLDCRRFAGLASRVEYGVASKVTI